MKMLGFFKSKKYLQRILISISLLIVSFIVFSSATMYMTAEKTVLKTQRDANDKILAQINYNITTMKEMVHTMATNLFWDPEVITLMSNKELLVFDLLSKLRKLDTTVRTTSFLDSILVYNNYTQQLYSGGNMMFRNPENIATIRIKDFLKEGKFNKMELTPVHFGNSDLEIDLFLYLVYDSLNFKFGNESALILNIKPDWLYSNITLINGLAMESESQAFLADSKGHLLNLEHQPSNSFNDFTEFFPMKLVELGQEKGSFYHQLGKQKRLISYAKTSISDVYLVTAQPYSAVLGKVYQMRITSIVMTGSFLLLSLIVSAWIGQKLYKPVEDLIKLVKHSPYQESDPLLPDRDELSYLSSMYKYISANLTSAKEEQQNNQKILQNYYIRKLITDSTAFSTEAFIEMLTQNDLQVAPRGFYLVGVMKIDDYSIRISRNSTYELKLFNFAILNIAQEILSRSYSCEAVDMRNNDLVVLISSVSGVEDYRELLPLFGEIQEVVLKFYKINVGIALSQSIQEFKDITHHYNLTQQYAMYQLVYGKDCILLPGMVKDNIENTTYHFPPDLERKLNEGLKSSDLVQFEDAIEKAMAYISGLNYDFIVYSITHIVVVLKNALKEMNSHRVQPIMIDLNMISQKVIEMKSLDEIRQLFVNMFHEMMENQKQVKEERNDLLTETIKDYVHANYKDNNLNLQVISGMLKLSSDYLGRLFKKCEGISVADYINEVRIHHAQTLLESKSYSINEIMEKVGYTNQSSFFKLFKKKFGTTPKEYRLKKSVDKQ
ncbi:helix-turn-helix domain-containing protein [Paenibacillus sp. LMG 31461]|uniref:Helix-turn-helix domain-containing protein n=1 Tax=Paenibacillus plantarum TaxID=2654975 RepID=A0ABX1X853_9BACL|nr:helix-turn-helix domain-containing protein [Paenibacillus plantarum]NOU64638.1 helix-turn-helix domain-containing protein [Paenibacillus plantarum]